MVYTMTAYRKDGTVIQKTDVTIDKGRHLDSLCSYATQAFDLLTGTETVITHNSDGCFVLAAHNDPGKSPLFSVATGWWQLPQVARHADHTGAYTARKAVDAWLDPILRERAALDRLEAALARLT